ncbi:hypothetical protein [Alteriqipengyuania lutimaris]|nr:hypothetical protein [Alteriqipengyuania lutimaris]MBB3032574.1 hypothetical protein [Alteriqipengyuania lutimaris]
MRLFAVLALLMASPAMAGDAEPVANAEMEAIFAADQEARQGGVKDWAAVSRADAERRARTRELLDAGALTTAEDFYAAAFVFQHGREPEDYLLAHTLAVRALGLGMAKAEWIAAATLDRYLQAIARPQVYGTQYSRFPGEPANQGRYDPELLSDTLREGAGVETLAQQQAKLDKMNAPDDDTK